MAVPGKNGALRGTRGTAFTVQTYSGVVLGIEGAASSAITEDFGILDNIPVNAGYDANVRQGSSGSIIRAKKILSSGDFAYNAAKFGTWIITKITTSVAGIANTNLLFMAQGSKIVSIHEFKHDFGVKMLTAWRTQRFAWLGKLATGASKNSRTMWLNQDGTAVAKPTTLTTVNMFDLRDGDATDQAVDDAARPTRAVPGTLLLKVDHVDSTLSSGNFFNYKPITGM